MRDIRLHLPITCLAEAFHFTLQVAPFYKKARGPVTILEEAKTQYHVANQSNRKKMHS